MRLIVPALLLTLAGCNNLVTPVTDESTGPTITFTQTATGSANVSGITGVDVDDANGPVTFNALATDPGGVQTIAISFSDQLYPPNNCTTTSGAGYGGGTIPYAPVPAAQSQAPALQNGLAQTELFTISTLQGPFTCDLAAIGIQDVARPYGATIYATVIATNYSGKTSTASLPITFAGWP